MGSRKVQGKKRPLEVLQLLFLHFKFSVGVRIGKMATSHSKDYCCKRQKLQFLGLSFCLNVIRTSEQNTFIALNLGRRISVIHVELAQWFSRKQFAGS